MLAYDYPMLDVFVTIVFLALFLVWLFLLLRVIADIFRDHTQSGGGKALWLLIIFVLPYIGVIAYLFVHGGDMALRSMEIDRRRAAVMRY